MPLTFVGALVLTVQVLRQIHGDKSEKIQRVNLVDRVLRTYQMIHVACQDVKLNPGSKLNWTWVAQALKTCGWYTDEVDEDLSKILQENYDLIVGISQNTGLNIHFKFDELTGETLPAAIQEQIDIIKAQIEATMKGEQPEGEPDAKGTDEVDLEGFYGKN